MAHAIDSKAGRQQDEHVIAYQDILILGADEQENIGIVNSYDLEDYLYDLRAIATESTYHKIEAYVMTRTERMTTVVTSGDDTITGFENTALVRL